MEHCVALCMTMALAGRAHGQLALADADRVTYSAHIAPIVDEKCRPCHQPGGGAPFSLNTYEDVRSRAALIRQVTRDGVMPPWKPRGDRDVFVGDRRLTPDEVARIDRWVAEGALEGSSPSTVRRTATGGWSLGEPDLILTMSDAYAMPADGADTIRTFVVPAATTVDRYVRALEFRPEVAGVVHHANIKIDRSGSTRRLDSEDPQPGFEGSGRQAQFPDGQFLGWTPGQRPNVAADQAWLLPAGSDLVLELHMTPSGKMERIQSRVGLWFTPRPPIRTPYMLRLGSQRLDISAGDSSYVSTDRFELPVDVEVFAVQAHAHNLARTVSGVARTPDGRRVPLLDIADWDFRWQDVYRFTQPVSLPRGSTVEMTITFDNSDGNPKNPNRPPKRVVFGQTSDSEMGDLWLQVVTATEGDRAMLDGSYAPKMLNEDIAGDEMLVAARPDDASVRRDLAYCYMAAGRAADAIAQLQKAIELEPSSADGRYQLGTLLLNQRRLDEAIVHLQAAIAAQPRWSESHNNMGVAHLLKGDLAEAVSAFDAAVTHDRGNAQAHFNRGRTLMLTKRPVEALAAFEAASRARPSDPDIVVATAAARAATGDANGAIRDYRAALRLRPDQVGALTDLAWILAHLTPVNPKTAAEAVALAERAAKITRRDNPVVLDTLAAGYFSAGRVPDAIRTAEEAVRLAEQRGDPTAARDIGERLRRYRGEAPTSVR